LFCSWTFENRIRCKINTIAMTEICFIKINLNKTCGTRHHNTNRMLFIIFFSLLHRAYCRVTQLLHQPLNIYKIYKILHIKTLKTLRHFSALRPSSGSCIFLAKFTLEIVTYYFVVQAGIIFITGILQACCHNTQLVQGN